MSKFGELLKVNQKGINTLKISEAVKVDIEVFHEGKSRRKWNKTLKQIQGLYNREGIGELNFKSCHIGHYDTGQKKVSIRGFFNKSDGSIVDLWIEWSIAGGNSNYDTDAIVEFRNKKGGRYYEELYQQLRKDLKFVTHSKSDIDIFAQFFKDNLVEIVEIVETF